MSASNAFGPDRLADRAEIQHRIHQFCHAVDRLRLDLLREVFHTDGVDDHGAYKGGVEGFIEWVATRHQTIAYSAHHVSNTTIEFASEDSAFVETYFLVWQSVNPQASLFAGSGDATPFEAISSGRYADHFTRKDGRWAIQSRTTIPGSMTKAVGNESIGMVPGFAVGTRDAADPALSLRATLGLAGS